MGRHGRTGALGARLSGADKESAIAPIYERHRARIDDIFPMDRGDDDDRAGDLPPLDPRAATSSTLRVPSTRRSSPRCARAQRSTSRSEPRRRRSSASSIGASSPVCRVAAPTHHAAHLDLMVKAGRVEKMVIIPRRMVISPSASNRRAPRDGAGPSGAPISDDALPIITREFILKVLALRPLVDVR